jgi:hypothetical protein
VRCLQLAGFPCMLLGVSSLQLLQPHGSKTTRLGKLWVSPEEPVCWGLKVRASCRVVGSNTRGVFRLWCYRAWTASDMMYRYVTVCTWLQSHAGGI